LRAALPDRDSSLHQTILNAAATEALAVPAAEATAQAAAEPEPQAAIVRKAADAVC